MLIEIEERRRAIRGRRRLRWNVLNWTAQRYCITRNWNRKDSYLRRRCVVNKVAHNSLRVCVCVPMTYVVCYRFAAYPAANRQWTHTVTHGHDRNDNTTMLLDSTDTSTINRDGAKRNRLRSIFINPKSKMEIYWEHTCDLNPVDWFEALHRAKSITFYSFSFRSQDGEGERHFVIFRVHIHYNSCWVLLNWIMMKNRKLSVCAHSSADTLFDCFPNFVLKRTAIWCIVHGLCICICRIVCDAVNSVQKS